MSKKPPSPEHQTAEAVYDAKRAEIERLNWKISSLEEQLRAAELAERRRVVEQVLRLRALGMDCIRLRCSHDFRVHCVDAILAELEGSADGPEGK